MYSPLKIVKRATVNKVPKSLYPSVYFGLSRFTARSRPPECFSRVPPNVAGTSACLRWHELGSKISWGIQFRIFKRDNYGMTNFLGYQNWLTCHWFLTLKRKRKTLIYLPEVSSKLCYLLRGYFEISSAKISGWRKVLPYQNHLTIIWFLTV